MRAQTPRSALPSGWLSRYQPRTGTTLRTWNSHLPGSFSDFTTREISLSPEPWALNPGSIVSPLGLCIHQLRLDWILLSSVLLSIRSFQWIASGQSTGQCFHRAGKGWCRHCGPVTCVRKGRRGHGQVRLQCVSYSANYCTDQWIRMRERKLFRMFRSELAKVRLFVSSLRTLFLTLQSRRLYPT